MKEWFIVDASAGEFDFGAVTKLTELSEEAQERSVHVIEKSAYDAVVAELEALKNPSDGRCMEIEGLRSLRYKQDFKIQQLTQERDALKAALEFYADKNNWTGNSMAGSGDYSRSYFKPDDYGDISYFDWAEYFTIKGKRAREALRNLSTIAESKESE